MEKAELDPRHRTAMKFFLIVVFGAISFLAGLAISQIAHAQTGSSHRATVGSGAKNPRVVYPAKTSLDFEGSAIEGELRNPGEFYFQHRPEDQLGSLIQRRKNFHKELLRDAVLSK